jgi:hypothetical protein
MGGGGVKIAIALVSFSLWAVSAIPLTAFAQDKPDQPPRATTEDCAVIAAVGEDQLHWREKSPDSAMYARSFGVDCDFKSMGIKDFDIPALGSGRYPVFSGLRFSFSRPIYSRDFITATIFYSFFANDGQHPSPFFSGYRCTAKRVGNNLWTATCKLSAIT